ncbi:hypothetical protein AT01_1260 [Yersinia aldovae 670-83]|nr:hypothetical protein AT01_1260 [Yersinia aldovae 670-83]
MGDLIEVCSLGVKPSYQPIGVLIQSALPGMIRAGKVDRCSRYFRYFLLLGKLRAVIGGQGFKLAESIGDNVPEGLVAKNGVVMKTEAIHPFFNEPT